MSPVDTYKIQLEQIRNTEADKPTKDLASKIVTLSRLLEKLSRIMETASKVTGKDVPGMETINRGINAVSGVEKTIGNLERTINQLESNLKGLKELPKAIGSAVSTGKQAISTVKESVKDKELTKVIKDLINVYRRVKTSEAYKTGRPETLKSIEKAVSELSKQKRSVEDLARSVKDLGRAVGAKGAVSPLVATKPEYKSIPDVRLFGKALRDMGIEFERIKRELKDKIVVAIDLETSEAKKFGKDAAAEFISQIAYQKGTLEQILAGTAKRGQVLVKPPAGVKTEEQYKKLIGNIGRAEPIPLKRLQKEGKEVVDAMQSIAEVLKDAEAVIGHNIAKFDISVLEQHFKKAGIKIESAVDKFIDTLQLSRANFPARGARAPWTRPHSLEQYEKDFKIAGVEIKAFGEGLHEGVYDLEVMSTLLRALNKDTKELAAVQGDLASKLQVIGKVVESSTRDFEQLKKASDKMGKVAEDADLLDDRISEYADSLSKAKKSVDKTSIQIENLANVRSALQASVFKEQVVKPQAAGPYAFGGGPGGTPPGGEQLANKLGDLAESLNKLQANIVGALERGLNKGMQILKTEAGDVFKLGPGGREWELKIANVRELRRALGEEFGAYTDVSATAEQLVDAYKKAFIRQRLNVMTDVEDMATAVLQEIGRLTKETVAGMGKEVQDLFSSIKRGTETVSTISEKPFEKVQDLFKNVALEARAERELTERFIKRIALPAAKVMPQGTVALETKYGAERALSNFATINTGLEKLANEAKALGATAEEFERFRRQISEAPLRGTSGTVEMSKAEDLASKLIGRVLELGGRTEVGRGYQKAIALRGLERGVFSKEQAREFVRTAHNIENLIVQAKELGITSLDVAKSLDEINFENFYDILDRLFKAGRVPFLEARAGELGRFDQSTMRQIAQVINDLQGLMPLVEPGKPRRAGYEEDVLRVFTKATEQLRPEEQKRHIVEVGLLWKDLADKAKKLGEGLFTDKPYLGRPTATSLDLSDAASSQLKQFNLDTRTSLKELNKTMVAMSTADVRSQAPFQQFSSLQRQLSYTTAALTGGLVGGGGLEIPALTSAREKALIKSGKFGAGGYGLNVLTELRDTAGTFEDQIMISGRLAKIFTNIVQRLVKPASTLAEGKVVTGIEPGVQKITPRAARAFTQSQDEFNRALGNVSKQFQEILGVPQKYRGRADVAEIGDEIVNVIREHRGEAIEVQTAKLVETFLNFFGRKFATRFGTKGVAVTPTRAGELPTEIKSVEEVASYIRAGFKGKVATGPGLGVAKIPKSMGELLAEMFEEAAPQATVDLRNRLIESGNKFIIEMFRDIEAGLVSEEEARKQSKLFADVSRAYKETFAQALPTGSAGIKEIQELYKEFFEGARQPFELKPIEARISARGVAKRGLMPEILEGVVNQLVGTQGTGITTLRDVIGKEALTETKEARMRLNEYLEALGYMGQTTEEMNRVIERIKAEKPDIDPAVLDRLREFESQWNVYTDTVDEFGQKIKSFVTPKFLQVIEEPHIYKEWSPEEIAKGIRGVRLDFQSFAAMAGVFGEGSRMLQELAESTTLASKEGWELIRAFQMLDPAMKDMKESMIKALPTVDLIDVNAFEAATGTIEDFKGTIFDISKFPTPFKLKIPTTKPGAEKFYEEMFVPGAALRSTYKEELLSKEAPTNISRYLANLITAAKEVEELAGVAASGGVGLGEEFQRKFASNIRAELTKSLTDTLKQFQQIERGAPTPQNIAFMEQTIEKFKTALSETRMVPPVYQEGLARTELESIEEYAKKAGGPAKFSKILGRIADILIGADPESLRKEVERIDASLKKYRETKRVPAAFESPYYQKLLQRPVYGGDFEKMMQGFLERVKARREARTAFDVELEAGNLDEFSKKVGINLQQSIEEALQLRKESLSKAKIRYFRELGQSVVGKGKGIEETFFRRVTPAVTGKAISAITDKTVELRNLLKTLSESKFDVDLDIPDLSVLISDLEKLAGKHEQYVKKAERLGLPILKEGEIGLPEAMAAKLKVRTGQGDEVETNLADLIKTQKRVFVESVRYPFTGTLSVQPHAARVMGKELAKHAIAVPGAPQLDIGELNKIITTLREFVGIIPRAERQYLPEETSSLLEKREQAWAEGTEESEKKANQFTDTIEKLIRVITDATPKFTNLEQKLDFDGDALFVHTGQLEESRREIQKHFEAFGGDITSVRNLFRSVFTAIDAGEVGTIAEMARIFGKKHPAEKGFEFLTRPYLEEQVKSLDLSEVMQSLFTYQPAAGEVKKGTDEWQRAVAEWSKSFVTNDILPEVFQRLGISGPVGTAYKEKALGTSSGMPEVTETTTALERNIRQLSEELVRRQLWEKRYADAVTGQLYKLHTGQTVESISRIARVSELETGFGRGLGGTGKGIQIQPQEGFLRRWPAESLALGGRPVQEFATRVNEIMRFVIQKGMDVKHAGVEAVGQKILANIGKKGGSEIIMRAMKEYKEDFDDLWKFNDQIANSVKLRLGKFSTEELKHELKRFEPDIDTSELDIDRQEIINRIVRHVNLEAVFEELFSQIQRQATKGLSKQLKSQVEEMPVGPKKLQLMRDVGAAGGFERFAAEQVAKEAASESGIAIASRITAQLQPLYQLRTSMETLGTTAKRTRAKVTPEEMLLPMGKVGEQFKRELETATKAAHVISRSLVEASAAPKAGIHGIMVLSAIKNRYKEFEELQKLEQKASGTAGRLPLVFGDIVETNKLAAEVWKQAGEAAGMGGGIGIIPPKMEDLADFLDKLAEVRRVAKEKISRVSEMAGLPPMAPEEKALLGAQAKAKYGTRTFGLLKEVISKGAIARGEKIMPEDLEQQAQDAYEQVTAIMEFQVSMIEQLRRVSEVIKTIPFQKEYLRKAFPAFDPEMELSGAFKNITDAQQESIDAHRNYAEMIESWYKRQQPTARPSELQDVVRTYKLHSTTAEEGLKKTVAESADALTEAIDKTIVKRKRSALKYLESRAAGKTPGKETQLYKMFRASSVHAGGVYGGGSQLEAVVSEMLGAPKGSEFLLEATGFRGTALHRRKQRELTAKFPGAEIEKPVEDLENKITGHVDAVYEKAGQKVVADIKTVYSTAQFERLGEISDEIEKRNITIQQKLDELKAEQPTSTIEKNVIRRLEDYISQVNVYLKNVEGAIGEIIVVSTFDPTKEITIPIGTFDPERFKRDLGVIQEARERVFRLVEALQAGQPIPEELFRDMPKIYEFISKKLSDLSPEEFVKKLPTRPLGEMQSSAQEVLSRLSMDQELAFERLSKEYLDLFRASGGPGLGAERQFKLWFAGGAAGGAAPPPPGGPPSPPTGGGPGDGDDFEEEIKKRIQKIVSRMQRGITPEVSEIAQLVQALDDVMDASLEARQKDDEQLARNLDALADAIRRIIEGAGATEESYREIAKLYKDLAELGRVPPTARDFTKFRIPDIERIKPDRPEAMHKNLKALYDAAIRVHRLAGDEEIQKFGPEIAALLTETAEKGPIQDITTQLSDAIAKLPAEKRGGLRRVWMFYKRAVSDYFLNKLDTLKDEIEKEAGTPAGQRAYREYEQVLERYLANIRGTLGRMSDIFTKAGPTGRKTEFVEPDIARLLGIYRTPQQLQEIVKQTSYLGGEFKPIMDVLVGDLDPTQIDSILTPLEKVRAAFDMLTKVDPAMKEVLGDSDLFRRMGQDAIKAWDFDRLVKGITQLRAGLQAYNRMQIGGVGGLGEEYTEPIRQNVEDTIRYLKQLERMFAPTGAAASPLGLVGVPPFLESQTQELIHKRNVAALQKYFEKPETAGGPAVGKAFTYRYKVVDPATKQVLSSMAEEFRKIGEEANRSGDRVGLFTQKTEDLVRSFQERRGIGQAFGRVVRWGLASRTVYGLVNSMRSMVNTIADVESGVAVLRQVMSPLETNFEELTQSAINFAKEFGLPIRQVVDSMRVFAQQGLAQEEVVDRTRTSMLAANVTTLSTTDATEAITAAMKVYGREGQSTLGFLDAWTEVEARHAITSADLANALKKSAAVAKTSGVSFHELNAIITGIGETSRQTGKEIGTSLRFVFRRIQSEKGPKQLAKIGIPVVGETGDLRSTFDILQDLSDQWGSLTNAQRLNIATAIGGRRHYNSLIILMDHWNDVLDALQHSVNSKGAAERRNMIVMETYAKRLQQVRGALNELQIQFGKFALPIAKIFLTGLKGVLEAVANIPPGLKAIAVGFAALFTIVAKGSDLISNLFTKVKGFMGVFGELGSQFMKQFKIGIVEAFGKLPAGLADIDVRGLSHVGEVGKTMSDFESIIGKAAFALSKFGRGWNDIMSEMAATGSVTFETIGKSFGGLGTLITGGAVRAAAKHPALAGILEVAGKGAELGEKGFNKLGELLGVPAEALAKWSLENTSFVKSVGPLAGSIAVLIPLASKAGDQLKKLAFSADQYEQSLAGVDRKLSEELSTMVELSNQYNRLEKMVREARDVGTPEAMAAGMRREEYVSPLLLLGTAYEKTKDFANEFAKTNISMVNSFDQFGNAVLKSTTNFKAFFETMRRSKIKEIAEKDASMLEKYAEELSNAGTISARFKSELKKFVGEVPGIGPIFAKQIKVSPAQELKEATEAVNRILSVRKKFPLTTAFDDLFNDYYKQLESARTRFRDFYSSFRRILGDMVTEGLSPEQIRSLLDRDALKPAFEMVLEVEGRLKQLTRTGYKLNWRDILGVEILKRVSPDVSFDYAAPLTKEMYKQSGIMARQGKAFAGDVVLFTEEVDKKFKLSGREGVLKWRDDLKWYVEAVSREYGTVEEIPYDRIKQFVDMIFPAHKMAAALEENVDILKEHLVGAVAGMVSISAKEFKREFGLGPRFFEQIPTETLIQTPLGFKGSVGAGPTGAFGQVPFKETFLGKGFKDIIGKYFVGELEKLDLFTAESKRRLEADKGFGPGYEERIKEIADVIKNNQVVAQWMALFVDVNKTLAEQNRLLEENIAAEKIRNTYLVETAGLLKGLPSSLSDVSLGVRNIFQLTTQQAIMEAERKLPPAQRRFTGLRERFIETGAKREAAVAVMERIERARIQQRYILEQARGAGAVATPERIRELTETIKKGVEPGGLDIQIQKDQLTHLSSLDFKMDDMLDALDPDRARIRGIEYAKDIGKTIGANIELLASPKAINVANKVFGLTPGETEIRHQFDRLAKLRNMHERKGNADVVKEIDNIMSDQSQKLISSLGAGRAMEVITGPGFIPSFQDVVTEMSRKIVGPFRMPEGMEQFFPGKFTVEDLISRALGGGDMRTFIQKLEEAVEPPGRREERRAQLADILRLQQPLASFLLPSRENIMKGKYGRLIESPQYKKLSSLMGEQNKISVSSSRTLQRLFAGYTAFNNLQKRAIQREERGYEAQKRVLKFQREAVLGRYRTGEITKEEFKEQISPINEEILEVARKAKEAAASVEERTTREAVGLIATASMTFARAAGFSEGALEKFGTAAAGSIIAWNTWETLTGETMPDTVRKATDALKKWSDSLGEEGLTWTEKFKFLLGKIGLGRFGGAAGAAGAAADDLNEMKKTQKDIFTSEEKDKIRKMKDLQATQEDVKRGEELVKSFAESDKKKLTDNEKIIDVNRSQLDVLLAIEENTRSSSENIERDAESTEEGDKRSEKSSKDSTRTLRDRLDEIKRASLGRGGSTGGRIKDVMAAATVLVGGGYLARKTQLGSELGEATRRAEKLNKAFTELAQRFPNQVTEIVRAISEARERELAGAGKQPEEVVVSRILDIVKANEELNKAFDDLAFKHRTNIEEYVSILEKAQDEMSVIHELGKIVYDGIRNFIKTIRDSAIDLQVDMRYATETVGAMRGLPSVQEIPVGKMEHELTPTERLIKRGGSAWENMYATFQLFNQARSGLIDLIKTNTKSIADSNLVFESTIRSEISNIEDHKAKASEVVKGFADLGSYGPKINLEGVIAKRKTQLERNRYIAKNIAGQYKTGEISSNVAGLALGKLNKQFVDFGQHVVSLEEILGSSSFKQSLLSLVEKTKLAGEQFSKQVDIQENLIGATAAVTKQLENLHNIFATGLNISQVLGDLEKARESLRRGAFQRQFENAFTEAFEMRVGGRHPLAPQLPTFEMLQAGVPESKLFGFTRRQQEMASIIAKTGRGPTLAEAQQSAFREKIDLRNWKQTQEDDKLMAQQREAVAIYMSVVDAMRRSADLGEIGKPLLEEFNEIRKELIRQAETAPQIARKLEPGVYERVGFNLESVYGSVENLMKTYSEVLPEGMKPAFEKTIEAIRLGAPDLFKVDPVVDAIGISNGYLSKIVDNTMPKDEMPPIFEKVKDVLLNAKTLIFGKGSSEEMSKQAGGHITGPGGPKDDRVPIWASNGEYVIRSSSARKIGRKALDYMNATGRLPGSKRGYAEGGLFGGIASTIGESADYWKKKRLGLADWTYEKEPKSFGEKLLQAGKEIIGPLGMGLAAIPDIGLRILKSPFEALGLIEQLSDWYTTSTLEGTLGKDIASVFEGIKKTGMPGLIGAAASGDVLATAKSLADPNAIRFLSGAAKGMKESFLEDISTGGTGMTAGILEALIPTNLLGKAKELGMVRTLTKVPKKKPKIIPEFNTDAWRKTREHIARLRSEGPMLRPQESMAMELGFDITPDMSPAEMEKALANFVKAKAHGSKVADQIEDYIHNISGLEKVMVDKSSIAKSVYTSKNRKEAVKGWADTVKQIKTVTDKLGTRGLNLKEITVGKLKKKEAAIFSPSHGKFTISEEAFRNPEAFRSGFAHTVKAGWTAPISEEKAFGEAFKYITSHEIAGHAFTAKPRVLMDPLAQALQEVTAKGFKKLTEGSKSVVSGYSLRNEREFMAEVMASAFHTPKTQATKLVKQIKEAKGLGSFDKGSAYIPQTQLAVVHKGEAIIPAKYNLGGLVGSSRYQMGGAVSPAKILQGIESAGEKLGEAIVRKIEEAQIEVNVPSVGDMPELSIGNLDELRTILEGGAVGADRTSKLDQFIESATEKLDRLEEQTVDNKDRITIVETQSSSLTELGDIKLTVNTLEEKVSQIYSKPEQQVDFADERSYVDTKINEAVNDLKLETVVPIQASVNRIDLLITELNRELDSQYDLLYSNINRLDLQR